MNEAPLDNIESIWWRDLKTVSQHPQHEDAFQNRTLWRVGCGDRIKFWEDNWIGEEGTLLAKYPSLYLISCQQNQIIQQMGVHKDTGWEWDFIWRRPLFDNEIDMVVSFLKDVEGKPIQPQRRDDSVWTADPSSQYSAQSAYNILRGETIEGTQDGAFEELCKLKVPSKISTFAWRLLRDRLPTTINLQLRQVEINDRRCPFCSSMEEDAGHLFFHCSKILPIWWESLSWVNIVGAFPQNPRQHFLQHISGLAVGIRINRWKCWWLALSWSIWQQRNKIIFSNETFNGNKVMDDAVFLLWTWLRSLEKDFATPYNHWSSNLRTGFVFFFLEGRKYIYY